jgi:hypothetical protein
MSSIEAFLEVLLFFSIQFNNSELQGWSSLFRMIAQSSNERNSDSGYQLRLFLHTQSFIVDEEVFVIVNAIVLDDSNPISKFSA